MARSGEEIPLIGIISSIAGTSKVMEQLFNDSGSSTSFSISTAAIQSIIERLRSQNNRDSTRCNNYNVWKIFNEFFIRLDVKPNSWEDRLVLFVGYLIEKKWKSSTIRSYISAIKAVLKQDNVTLDENTYLLASLTKACKLKNDVVKIRLPIRWDLLCLMIKTIPILFAEADQPYLVCLYQALLATTYFGLFRVGEVCASDHVIKVKDVHVGVNKNKMMFVLHTSKTHWNNVKPQVVKINSREFDAVGNRMANIAQINKKCCPFRLLNRFLAVRPCRSGDKEQFFIFRDRSAVTPYHLRLLLRKLFMQLNMDHTLCGCQSVKFRKSE